MPSNHCGNNNNEATSFSSTESLAFTEVCGLIEETGEVSEKSNEASLIIEPESAVIRTAVLGERCPNLDGEKTARALRILDSLGYGGVLVGPDGQVMSTNLCARRSFGEGLAVREGILRATDRNADQQLKSMTRAGSSQVDFSLALPVQRSTKLPLIIRAERVDGCLLFVILDPDISLTPPEEVLAKSFELTPAEIEVAVGIASGKALPEIADERGVKVGTVRAHLKVILSKTHTHSQARLMRLLTRLAIFAPLTQDAKRARHA